jgi:hypothetical protein
MAVGGGYVPRVDRRLPPSWPSDEPDSGPTYELEDGAKLFFGDLGDG